MAGRKGGNVKAEPAGPGPYAGNHTHPAEYYETDGDHACDSRRCACERCMRPLHALPGSKTMGPV